MLVVMLGNARLEGKHLSLARVKSSLVNEEPRRKEWEPGNDLKALIIESDTDRGRDRNRSPQNRESRG